MVIDKAETIEVPVDMKAKGLMAGGIMVFVSGVGEDSIVMSQSDSSKHLEVSVPAYGPTTFHVDIVQRGKSVQSAEITKHPVNGEVSATFQTQYQGEDVGYRVRVLGQEIFILFRKYF